MLSYAKTSVNVDFFGIYKITTDIVVDIIDCDILKQQFRWIRPKALMNGAESKFDFAIRPYSGIKKLLDTSILFNDALNINFNKDLGTTFIDILDLGWNHIMYPEDVSEDDTKHAFETTDFLPSYSSDFSYGGKVGLVPEDIHFKPIRAIIRDIKGVSNWEFEVLQLFNFWIFNTRSD